MQSARISADCSTPSPNRTATRSRFPQKATQQSTGYIQSNPNTRLQFGAPTLPDHAINGVTTQQIAPTVSEVRIEGARGTDEVSLVERRRRIGT